MNVDNELADFEVAGSLAEELPYSGCLREGAKSYVKRLRPERGSAPGQRYSPVKLMCSHPRGEMWARNSAGFSRPGLLPGEAGLAELQRVPVDDDRGQQVKAGDPVVLAFPGSVAQFAALVEVDGALEGMVRLAFVQSDLGPPAHVGGP